VRRLLLVEAPWGASLRPALGLHVLKAYLETHYSDEIKVDVWYGNLDFYDGLPGCFDKGLLQEVFWSNPEITWIAEGFYAPWAYPEPSVRERMIQDFSDRLNSLALDPQSERGVSPVLHDWLSTHISDVQHVLHQQVPAWIASFSSHPLVQEADVVGFGHHFNQFFGSLALALALREARPDLPILLGGASVTAPLASLVTREFPQVTNLFVGESEVSLAAFCQALRPENGLTTGPARTHEFSTPAGMAHSARTDFSGFFGKIEGSRFESQLRSVPVEFTRDCYWARKSQCTFCGLPSFRSSVSCPPEDVCRHVSSLHDDFGANHFIFTDPAIHHGKARDLIRGLVSRFGDRDDAPVFFFEMRADTPKAFLREVARLRSVVVQVGVESFATDNLALMRKGVTAITNVQFLKWCRELRIFPYYNLLYAHPGEDPTQYELERRVIPQIVHLNAPSGYTPVLLCRDSPLFEEGSPFISNRKALREYRYSFPQLSPADLDSAAYYFDFEGFDRLGKPLATQPRVRELVREWQRLSQGGEQPHLVHYHDDGRVVVSDSRATALIGTPERVVEIRDPQVVAVMDCLDAAMTVAELDAAMRAKGFDLAPEELSRGVECLDEHGLLMEESGQLLCLSVLI
jgi:ribosomal peptide maturation radical SAM protein 1